MKVLSGLFSQYRGLRKEVYILFFGRIVTNMGSMVWPMLTMILNQKLGLEAFAISAVVVGGMVLMAPANLLGGRLADRRNKKNVIVVCDSISILCYLICAAVPLGYASVGLMLAAGICQSMEWPSYNALIADLTLTRDRERAYSLEYLGANLGLVLSPTLAGLLFRDYLWLSFLISGLAIACSTALIFCFIRDITPVEDRSEAAAYQSAAEGVRLRQVLRENPVILLYLLFGALYGAIYAQYNYLMPLDMGRVHGADGALIFGTVSSLNCVVVVLFTPLITRLFRKMPETWKFFTGQCFIGAGYGLFLLLLGQIPVYYLAMLLFTWGEIFSTIGDGPYLTSRIPASHRGRVNAFVSVLATAMQGLCALSVGRIYERLSPTLAWGLVFALLLLSLILLLALVRRDRRAYPKLYSQK